jgi:hypothetical protein
LEKEQGKHGVAVNVITRSQSNKLAEQAKRDEELDAQVGAQPIPVTVESEPEGSTDEQVTVEWIMNV